MASTTSTRKTGKGGASRRGASRGRPRRAASGSNQAGVKGGKAEAKGGSRSTSGSQRGDDDPPRRAGRLLRPFRDHLGAQKRDAGGLALLVVGIVVGLGTYADAAGPVGAFLEATTLGLLGLVGYLVPVLLAWFGLLVVLGRPGEEVGRIAVGSVVLAIGLLGGLHLLAGAPDPAAGVRELWLAGGLIGWTVATPLAWALSVWGASAVLAALVVLGLLVVTKTPVSAVIAGVRRLFGSRRGARGAGDEVAAADASQADETVRSERPADDTEADAAAAERERARVRATLEGKRGEQLPLEQIPTDDGAQTQAQQAATAPSEPADPSGSETVPVKARPVVPVDDYDDYHLPSLELLTAGQSLEERSARTIEAQTAALQDTFHQFGVDATVARWSRGPTVTRFEIELGPGVQVKKVANMGDDIAYALAAPDVRIVAPIPGKSAIGVEVPNRERDLITLGDILRSQEAVSDPHPLTVALGVDIAGNPELVNLTTMPHLLVSGATGSGKSVTLNGMISSVIMRARPDQVRMILIDPKRVELNHYQGAPHLLALVVTDPRRAADAVQWCVKEMEQRYD
ncbi:MAG: DNA translocase FtsK 4TM domain-containing protein, partial [Actinomycetota bacterium]